jgi:2-polyprenyl-3-methyl-5-hydroxy-6-metoxy-1,4-benzoquinol methylase
LAGKSVLEIGCSEGYFSRELTKRGYEVTAIDKNSGYIAACRYLATIGGLKVDYKISHWQEYLNDDVYFDNILFLSVLHNDMKFMPIEDALKGLHLFRGKCFRLFLEVPNNEKEQDWSAEKYDFLDPKNIDYICKEMVMVHKQTWQGWRPIRVLDKAVPMGPISEKEWESHNKWEREWWGDCKDTFDEQLKQQTYAELMKLPQFAVHRHGYNLHGMSVLDIGGGPVSLLLRCYNYRRAVVVDPCTFPQWVMDRYSMAKIEYFKDQAEIITFAEKFDEVWLYNCLQHVQDPARVIEMARRSAKKIRVAEVIEIGVYLGHPQNLTKDILDSLFGREGLVEQKSGIAHGLFYFGVFNYEE